MEAGRALHGGSQGLRARDDQAASGQGDCDGQASRDPAQAAKDVSLQTYLRRAQRPFDWATLNCWFFVADWIVAARGIDPAADLRGRFTTRIGCLRVLRRCGFDGWAQAADCLATRAGLVEIDPLEAKRGDIGAGTSITDHQVIGLICTGKYWAAKIGPGLWIGRAKISKAWSVNARSSCGSSSGGGGGH